MEQNEKDFERRINHSRVGGGVFLLLAGFLLLAYKMGAPIPSWVFTWPVLLIVIGLFTGIKSRFHNPGSFILILIGGVFLIDQSVPGIDLHNFIAPIILIGLGFLFIMRPRRQSFRYYRKIRWGRTPFAGPETEFTPQNTDRLEGKEEYLDVHAILGGVKKNVQSKNFKGGEIVCFMGGAEINLMQADIQHPVTLEINTVFGGTKLIIPGNWEVQTEISAVFGGVEDKRNFQNQNPDDGKKIILKGSCLFGGIEINNY
ncbi:MAG: LiaF domain-containing protein [Ginsengibacter sp.]